jgi:hypothetical protein
MAVIESLITASWDSWEVLRPGASDPLAEGSVSESTQ